jgi:4-amino-4-deoxy-L-arabinose transferase-like glycosyltransferase
MWAPAFRACYRQFHEEPEEGYHNVHSKRDAAHVFPMKAIINSLLKHWAGITVVAVSSCVVFWRLGQNSLSDWDEAIYAEVSKEILSSGDWITLHWNFKAWFEKPPLLMWITAIFYRWFGITEFFSRAGSAVCGVGVASVTYLIGKTIYGRTVGLGAALILLSTLQFLLAARFGTTDVMLTFFVYLGLYGYLRTFEGDSRWWYLAWISIGLAIMAKGAAGLVALLVICVCVGITRTFWTTSRSRDFWQGFLLALLIMVPWHVAVYLQNSEAFTNSYIFYHVLARSTRSLEGHIGGPFFYLDVLAKDFVPWFYLAPIALGLALRENVVKVSKSVVLLVAVGMVCLIYAVVKTKLHWYIIPVYPSLAILISAMIGESICSHKSASYVGLLITMPIIYLSIPDSSSKLLVLVAVIVILSSLALTRVPARKKYATSAVLMVLALFLIGFRNIEPAFHNHGMSSVAQIAKAAGEDDSDHASLIVYSGIGWPTLLFYSSRRVFIASSEADISRILARSESRAIILTKDDLNRLASHYAVRVVAERGPYVYARILPDRSR